MAGKIHLYDSFVSLLMAFSAANIMTVMKIYRRSIKKSTSMYFETDRCYIGPVFIDDDWKSERLSCFLVIELCVLSFIVACTATQLFYVVLTENSLIVKIRHIASGMLNFNSILLKKLKSAIKGGLSRPYIQVMTPAKKSWRYVTDLVDERDYQFNSNITREGLHGGNSRIASYPQ